MRKLAFIIALSFLSVQAKAGSDQEFYDLRLDFLNAVISKTTDLVDNGVNPVFLQKFTYQQRKWLILPLDEDHYPELVQFKILLEQMMEAVDETQIVEQARILHTELQRRVLLIEKKYPLKVL